MKKHQIGLKVGAVVLAVVIVMAGTGWVAPAAQPLGTGLGERIVNAESIQAPTQIFLPLVAQRFPLPIDLFGVTLTPGSTGTNEILATKTKWIRDTWISWKDVEATKGTRQWSLLAAQEAQMQTASANQWSLIVAVSQAPTWAQSVPGKSCAPIKSGELATFASFMHDVVARYSVAPYNVKYWEIWNEPDIDYALVDASSPFGCWGNAADAYYGGGYYADMLKLVYPQIKAADPNAQVLMGGLLLDCDPNNPPYIDPSNPSAGRKNCGPAKFLEGILRNGGAPYFDIVSFHAYDFDNYAGHYYNPGWSTAWNTSGPVLLAKANFLKNTLAAYGASSKPLMNTEVALISWACTTSTPAFEATKANYVVESYAAAISIGLKANVWYGATTPNWFCSWLLNGSTPTAAYTAYQFAATELRGATFVQNITQYTGIRGYVFDRGDRRIWALWSKDGASHSITLPAGSVAAYKLDGSSLTLSTPQAVLNPIYVEYP